MKKNTTLTKMLDRIFNAVGEYIHNYASLISTSDKTWSVAALGV